MKKEEIYDDYLAKIREVLEKDDFEAMDYILEYMYTSGMPENVITEIDEILQEMTLYIELKEKEYKERALELIDAYKAVDDQ